MSRRKDPQADFRKVLRSKRRALGMTQDDVADLLGMSRLTYHRIERGGRQLHFADLAGICELFKMDPDELLGDLAPAFRSVTSIIEAEKAAAAPATDK